MNNKNQNTMSTQKQTPADTMAVTQTSAAPPAKATVEDRGVTYLAFASKIEVKLTPRMVLDYLCVPTKSGVRANYADAVKFMKLCEARALNPWEGDAFLQGYDSKNGPMFNLITAHQAFLKRAEISEHYAGKESGVIVLDNESKQVLELQGDFYLKKQQTLLGSWAKVYRKDRQYPEYKRLNLESFDKGWGRWETDPGGMIVKCAEADALRSAFPTTIGGLYLAEELNLEKNVTPPQISAPSFITQPPASLADVPIGAAGGVNKAIREMRAEGHGPADPEKQIDDTEAKAADEAAAAQGHDKTAAEHRAQEDPLAEPAKPVDKCEGLEGKQVLDLLFQLMKKDGVSEDQVIGYCRSLKPPLAKPNQNELPNLADSKLRTLANSWETILPAIKAVSV